MPDLTPDHSVLTGYLNEFVAVLTCLAVLMGVVPGTVVALRLISVRSQIKRPEPNPEA